MSGQPIAERIGGSTDEPLAILEDLNERILNLERVSRMPATGASVVAVVSAVNMADPTDRPPDWTYVVDESQWYRVQSPRGNTSPASWVRAERGPN